MPQEPKSYFKWIAFVLYLPLIIGIVPAFNIKPIPKIEHSVTVIEEHIPELTVVIDEPTIQFIEQPRRQFKIQRIEQTIQSNDEELDTVVAEISGPPPNPFDNQP